MSYLNKIRALNRCEGGPFVPLSVDGLACGYVSQARRELLVRFDAQVSSHNVEIKTGATDRAARTRFMAQLCERLRSEGHVKPRFGEDFAVRGRFSDPEHFRLDRAAMSFFGFISVGIHMNGYVRRPDGLYLWIATRAKDRGVEPGKLDNMVAGGQPAGIGLMENLIKEGAEEADLQADQMAAAVPVGQTSYCLTTPEGGLRRDVLFLYDLEVPETFKPRNTDGEIDGFEMMKAADVLACVRDTDRVKFNVNAVLIDFGLRHGVINPDREPDYEPICRGLGATLRPGDLEVVLGN